MHTDYGGDRQPASLEISTLMILTNYLADWKLGQVHAGNITVQALCGLLAFFQAYLAAVV